MKVEQNKMVGVDYKLTVDGQIADQSRPGLAAPNSSSERACCFPNSRRRFWARRSANRSRSPSNPRTATADHRRSHRRSAERYIHGGRQTGRDILFVGSQVPMSDAQGNRVMGIVKEVSDTTVKMDFNHPMAGKTLNFEGRRGFGARRRPRISRAAVRAEGGAGTAAAKAAARLRRPQRTRTLHYH